MRLLTHNFLRSTMEGVTNNYPLKIQVEKVIVIEDDFETEYLKRLFHKIDWKALVYASKALGYNELPEEFPNKSVLKSNDFLKKFHHALLELHLEEGALICPETGHCFPVKNGLPNMAFREILLTDKESMAIEETSDDKQTQNSVSDGKGKAKTGKKKKQARNKRRDNKNKQKQILPSDDKSIPSTKKEPVNWVGKGIEWGPLYKPNIEVIRRSGDSSSDDEDF